MNGKVLPSAEVKPFRLEHWDIYPDSGEIVRDQKSIHLEPRAMAVLCALAFEPDYTLSREELITRVWGDAVVTDDAITRVIYKLRQVLGDDPQQPSYIQTLPKLGYRLIAKPRFIDSDQVPNTGRKINFGLMTLLLIAVLLVGYLVSQLTAENQTDQIKQLDDYSIAVLPFEDFRPAAPDDHLADSITDELINSLANLKQLQGVARTSVFSLKQDSLDVRQLGTRLNANTVVEGSIRRNGDNLRLIVQLIDVDSGFHLLSETIERQPDDIFSFSAQIVPSIAATLNLTTSPEELARATAIPSNKEAQRLTIQGRYHWHQRRPDALEKALGYFERAIELAPDYAPAWSGLCDTLVFSSYYGNKNLADVKDRAKQAADKAMQLDPGLAGAHASLGLLHQHLYQHAKALENLQTAVILNPNNAMAHMWLGRSHFASGRFLHAMQAYQRSASLDPISPIIFQNIGMAGLLAGETDEAESAYQKSIEFAPENLYARWALAYLLWSKGALQAADATYSEIVEKGLKRADVLAQASIVALDAGDLAKAGLMLEQAISLNKDDDWVRTAEWSYQMSQQQYDEIQSSSESPSNDDIARQALAGLLNNNLQFALDKYSILLEQGEAGNEILFDQWSIEWGFSHALYLRQLYLKSGNQVAADGLKIKFDNFFQKLLQQGLRTAGTDYIAASIAAVDDQPELAMSYLTEAINRGWSKLWWLTQDPAFYPLRDDPAYVAGVEKLRSRLAVSRQEN